MTYKELISKSVLKDVTLWSLVFSNLMTIYFAIEQGWNSSVLLWAFWAQSLIEGLFYVRKMVILIKTQKSNTDPNKQTPPYDVQLKLHYPGFIIILFFSSMGLYGYIPLSKIGLTNITFILLAVLLSLLNCLVATLYGKNYEEKTKIEYDDPYIMNSYKRMFVLYAVLMLCLFLGDKNITLAFLILKAIVNIKLHIEEKQKSGVQEMQTTV